jgi:hypothetical protein
VPFTFTGANKSKLGWDFLGLIQTGRFKEYRETMPPGSPEANLTQQFWSQMRSIRHDVKTGPGMLMQWSAPKGEGHDDLVVSAALAVVLDGYDFRLRIARGSFRDG